MGISNFADADNDNDGLSDTIEVAQGSDINVVTPSIATVQPNLVPLGVTSRIAVTGDFFLPGLALTVDGAATTPLNLSTSQFEFDHLATSGGALPITVALPNGEQVTSTALFSDPPDVVSHPITVTAGAFELDHRGDELVVASHQRVALDTVTDGIDSFSTIKILTSNFPGSVIRLDPSGRVATLRFSFGAFRFVTDTDGNEVPETEWVIESGFSPGTAGGSALAFDPSGNPAMFYARSFEGTTTAVVAHDRDGSADATGTNELLPLETLAAFPALSDIAVDSLGRVAVVYQVGNDLRVAHDRSGDGDFDDVVGGQPETHTLSLGASTCLGLAFDASDRLALVTSVASGPWLIVDDDANGAFSPAEQQLLPSDTTSPEGCDLIGIPTGLAVAHNGGDPAVPGAVRLFVDLDTDGAFTSLGEDRLIGEGITTDFKITRRANGAFAAASLQGFVALP